MSMRKVSLKIANMNTKCVLTMGWEAKSWLTLRQIILFHHPQKNLKGRAVPSIKPFDQNTHRCLAKRDEKTKELLSCKEKVSIFFEAPGCLNFQMPQHLIVKNLGEF